MTLRMIGAQTYLISLSQVHQKCVWWISMEGNLLIYKMHLKNGLYGGESLLQLSRPASEIGSMI